MGLHEESAPNPICKRDTSRFRTTPAPWKHLACNMLSGLRPSTSHALDITTASGRDLTDNLYFRMRHYFAKQGGELKRCTCEVQYANVYIQNSSGISQTRLRSSLSSESPYLVHAWGFLGPCPSTCPSDTLISCSMKVMSSLRAAAVQSGARRS